MLGLSKKQNKQQEIRETKKEQNTFLKAKSVKEMIAPSGIDASNLDRIEIISNSKRYARSFFISNLPRMCTFPELFRNLYMFGDMNTSIYINPIAEANSQNQLNRVINELETERIIAEDRGNINRARLLAQKRVETEELRDEIASGFNKLYEATIVSTLYDYDLKELDRYSKLLATEMSKSLVGIKTAWAMQEDALQTNMPLMKQ